MVFNKGRLEETVSYPKSDGEWHSFIDGHFDDALKIKRHIESLDDCVGTFRLKDVDGLSNANLIDHRIPKISGTWKKPDVLTGAGPQKWVNPNYVHAQHYSDAVTQCACGIPVLRESFSENEKQPAHHQEHEPGCTKIDRLESRVRLHKNRKRIIQEVYAVGNTLGSSHPRLGYPQDRHMGGAEVNAIGLDLGELQKEGRKKVARTFLVLCREYSPEQVGELYGVHRRSVSSIITEETVSSAKSLYSVRRRSSSLAD